MKKILIALVALSLAACSPRDLDDVMVFVKHDETGLCFFGEDWNGDGIPGSGTMGNVPCTPEVENWIENHK